MHSRPGQGLFTFPRVDYTLLCAIIRVAAWDDENPHVRNCNGKGSYVSSDSESHLIRMNACLSPQSKWMNVRCLGASCTVSMGHSVICLFRMPVRVASSQSTVVAIEVDQGCVSWGICHQRCPSLLIHLSSQLLLDNPLTDIITHPHPITLTVH